MNRLRHFLILCVFFTALALPAATRVAIVSAHYGNLEDLMTARLSEIRDVELLERGEISKIIKEQKLETQIITEKQVLSLGKILKADLFAVIETHAEKKAPIGMIVFDADTGIRYWDSALPEADTEETAEFVVKALKQAMDKKKKAQEGKLTYVSLLSVRNTDLPREKDPFCKAVGILLMRQLGNSPDITVLERCHLDWLNKERNLPGTEQQNKLLASTMLLELEISRATDGKGIRAILLLPEKENISAESHMNEPANLANQLAANFAESKKLDKIVPELVNISNEARRFHNEHLHMNAHSLETESFEKISAAYALSSSDRRIAMGYVNSLARQADTKKMSDMNEFNAGIDLVERALDLSEQLYDKTKPFEIACSFRIFEASPSNTRALNLSDLTEESQKRLETAHTRWMDLMFRALLDNEVKDINAIPRNKKDYMGYTFCVWKYTECMLTNKKWMQDAFPKIDKWLDMTTDYCLNTGDNAVSISISSPLASVERFICSNSEYAVKNHKEFEPLIKKISSHSAYNVKIYGLKLSSMLNAEKEVYENLKSIKRAEISGDEWRRMYFAESEKVSRSHYPVFFEEWKKQYNSLPPDTSPEVKESFYSCAKEICHTADGLYGLDRHLELYDFMSDRKELSTCVAFVGILNSWMAKKHPAKIIEVYERNMMMADSSDTQLLPSKEEIARRIKDAAAPYNIAVSMLQNLKRLWTSEKIFDLKTISGKSSVRILSLALGNDGDSAFIACYADNPVKTISVYRVSFESDDIKIIGSIDGLTAAPSTFSDCTAESLYSYVDSDYYVLSTHIGVYVLPLAGSDNHITKIDKDKGIPSAWTHAACRIGNKIFAVTGEPSTTTFLLSYDLVKGNAETVMSTMEKSHDKKSHFAIPYRARAIFPGVDGKRIFLLVEIDGTHSGLWEYSVDENKWKHLLRTQNMVIDAQLRGHKAIISSSRFSCTFDLVTHDFKAIISETDIQGESPILKYDRKDGTGPRIITNDYVMYARPFSRRLLKNGETEHLHNPLARSILFLKLSGDGKRILAGTNDTIAILTLNEQH